MKIMFFFITILFLMPSAYSQDKPSDKIYELLKDKESVSLLTFSKDIINMVDININNDGAKNVKEQLSEIRVAICKKTSANNASLEIVDFLKKSPFQEVEMEDDDLNVYVHRKGRTIKECHITIPDDESLILFSFYGEFRIEDLKKLKESAVNFNWY